MYRDLIVIDGLQYSKWDRDYFRFLQESGISAVHVTLAYHESARETLSLFAEWNGHFGEHGDLIVPMREVQDIQAAKETGRTAVFFGAQNCSPIDDEIGLVEVMRNLGLCIMQLTYNNQSLLATGCYEDEDAGITRFGRQVISEMNRVGMVIDMSHSGDRSTREAIDISSRPICISHANPKTASDSLRNKSDEVLRHLFGRGGLLGFSLYPFHLPERSECTLEMFCRLVADTAERFGSENLAIGSDLCLNQPESKLRWMRMGRWSKQIDYGEGSAKDSLWPDPLPWFCDSRGMENIYSGLLACGFGEKEAGGIIGQNWLNFLSTGLAGE